VTFSIDDFIDLTNSSTLKPDLPVTIVAWINIEKDGGIFHNNPAFNRFYGFWLNSQANGKISA